MDAEIWGETSTCAVSTVQNNRTVCWEESFPAKHTRGSIICSLAYDYTLVLHICFLSFLVTISETVMLGYIESGYRTEAASWRSRSVRLIFINPIKSCKYLLQYLLLSNWFCKYIKHLLSRWLSHYHFLNTLIVFLVQLVVSYTYLTCCLKYHNLHTF